MGSSIISIGLQGVHEGMERLAKDAERVTRAFRPDSTDEPTDALVALKVDEFQIRASRAVISVGASLEKSVLDILA